MEVKDTDSNFGGLKVTDRVNDVGIFGRPKAMGVAGGVEVSKEKAGSPEEEKKSDLIDTIKKAVKEALEEAMKDFVVKEAKKKKQKVAGENPTPKKKSKKSEGVEVDSVKAVTPKKKKTSKKRELVITKDPIKE